MWEGSCMITKVVCACIKGPTHRLEMRAAPESDLSHSALRLADLSTDEEEALQGRIHQYERKIDSLMTEVGSLKNEVGFALTFSYVKGFGLLIGI